MNAAQPSKYQNTIIDEYDFSVYKLKVARESPAFADIKTWLTRAYLRERYIDARNGAALVLRFIGEIFRIAPLQFCVVESARLWTSLSGLFDAYTRARLLRAVEGSITEDGSDPSNVIYTLLLYVLSSLFSAGVAWFLQRKRSDFGDKVRQHFEMRHMEDTLKLDLAGLTAIEGHESVRPNNAVAVYSTLVRYLGHITGIMGQLAFVVDCCRRVGNPGLILISVLIPLFLSSGRKTTTATKKCIAYNNNEHDMRMKALTKMEKSVERQDIVLGGLADWIFTEFKKAFDARGDVMLVRNPIRAWDEYHTRSGKSRILNKIGMELPLVYLVVLSLFNSSTISLASITVLAEASRTLMSTLAPRNSLNNLRRTKAAVAQIRRMYEEVKSFNKMDSGVLPYPMPDNEEHGLLEQDEPKMGMRLELNDVSFSYPGTRSTRPALDNVSFTIKPGQLVVLVGTNGSGKSTLVRILSRLYDHTSGEVLIDGRPSSAYDLGDIKRAIALLSQDGKTYPLSLGENIGVGYPGMIGNEEMIQTAAENGGATGFISKLSDGFGTVLDPMVDLWSVNLHNKPEHPLAKEMEEMRKKIEISGGEKQRLVASRTFMKMNSKAIRLVAVDEPTSALDAEGELHLFRRLLEMKGGRTMVFVTHRFGHLTKHADVILCMKEGRLVETGTHDELLMKADGEYAKLYNAQASAFSK